MTVWDEGLSEYRSPNFGECSEQWVFDFVAAIFGSDDAATGNQLIRKYYLLISKTMQGRLSRRASCSPRSSCVSAAWHDAVCLPINRDVRVNEMAPLDLRALLDGTPPPGCGGSGDWRRVSELCRPSTAPAP